MMIPSVEADVSVEAIMSDYPRRRTGGGTDKFLRRNHPQA